MSNATSGNIPGEVGGGSGGDGDLES